MQSKKRVLGVIPPFFRLLNSHNNRVMPGIHYLIEILKNRGHVAGLLNGDFYPSSEYADWESIMKNHGLYQKRVAEGHKSFDEVYKVIEKFQPDIVIILAGDVLLPTVDLGSFVTAQKVASDIKSKFPGVVTVGYGQQVSFADPETKKNFDVVIRGEGEGSIVKIVEEDVRGHVGPDYPNELDSLPILTEGVLYHKPAPEDWDYIMSNRGCPFRCTFCYQPELRGKDVRFFSTERFVKEIVYRIENFGTKGFYFADMIFPLGKQRTLERCDALIKVKDKYPDFHWWCEARVDSIPTLEVAQKMKEAGCVHLKFGVEMANNEMLKVIQKDINLDKVKKAFDIASQADLKTTVYVLLGCPGFHDKDYQEMFGFFKDLNADNYVININVPYVGTKLFNQIKDQLHEFGLYQKGEEGFSHTSEKMQKFWGISQETLDMYFALNVGSKKDDAQTRTYVKKIGEESGE